MSNLSGNMWWYSGKKEICHNEIDPLQYSIYITFRAHVAMQTNIRWKALNIEIDETYYKNIIKARVC